MNKNNLKNLLAMIFFILSLFNSNSYALKENKTKKSDSSTCIRLELENLKAIDYPYDKGESGLVLWSKPKLEDKNTTYVVYISSISEIAGWTKIAEFKTGERTADKIDLPFWTWNKDKNIYAVKFSAAELFPGAVEKRMDYYAKVLAIINGKNYESPVVKGYIKGNWFRWDRINHLLLLIIVSIVFFTAVSHAKRKGLFIRRIAGLDAIDEAIGRATEMGKPIFYIPGIGSMASISTIASTFILGEVAKKVAQYDSYIKVPHYDPIVMTVSKEIVKQSYIEAERPDSYREDINVFVSADQFSYAASIDGMMTREKPAACFFMGYFMAESLLLAEVGASTGAIQIAGTDVEHQLPFFFTACDYTLIGEELYAAGAYLSKEPMLLSALKVQDFGKLVVMLSVGIFSVILLITAKLGWERISEIILNLLKVY